MNVQRVRAEQVKYSEIPSLEQFTFFAKKVGDEIAKLPEGHKREQGFIDGMNALLLANQSINRGRVGQPDKVRYPGRD